MRITNRLFPIERVVVYTGHKHPLLGPYAESIKKRIEMLKELNIYREERGRKPWRVEESSGEDLVETLYNPKRTLLVIPAGESTRLDQVFSADQLHFIQHDFFEKGGRGYFNCGSAYWASKTRVYNDLCSEQPTQRKLLVKKSRIPLFNGITSGPICTHPSPSYKVGFFSDAVKVTSQNSSCTFLLSGGGSFHPKKGDLNVRVLAKYPHAELIRCGKSPDECADLENAAILVRIQRGAALLWMVHPYYSSQDLDPERYEQTFPGSGTNWKRIVQNLSSKEHRMNFVLEKFLFPLEDIHNDK